MFSLASVGTMVACLFMLSVFLCILLNFHYIVGGAEASVTISVYFEDDIDENRIAQIGKDIAKREEVEKVEYKTADEAWKSFSKEYYNDDQALIDSFGGENPLGDSDSYIVTLKKIKDQEEMTKYLNAISGVRYVNSPLNTTATLMKLNNIISVVSIALIIILFFVAIFLISNTIVVAISVRKEEIAIMKLIGATDHFIRGPFVVEGVTIGLIGSLLPLAVLFLLYQSLLHFVRTDLSQMVSWLSLLSAGKVFAILIPVNLVLGIGIGLLGSMITVKKHLNV